MRCTTMFLSDVTVVLAVAGMAHAGAVLVTGPVEITQDCPKCAAINISSKPISSVTVEVHIVNSTAVLGSLTCTDLAPNAQCSPIIGCNFSTTVYCRVTVDGSKKAIRAVLTPIDEIHGPIVVLPAY